MCSFFLCVLLSCFLFLFCSSAAPFVGPPSSLPVVLSLRCCLSYLSILLFAVFLWWFSSLSCAVGGGLVEVVGV